jgi:hypothetical protein
VNDSNELERLRGQVADLEAQMTHDNETRARLVSAADALLPSLAKQQQQWERQHAAHLEALRRAPELERLREEGLMPKYAELATRQRALEEQYNELRGLAVETFTAMRELVELLKRGDE